MNCTSIVEARYIADYRIWLKFNTNETGEVDLRELIFSHHAAESLRDPGKFSKFHLDSWPTLAWDCGYDVDPESLYMRVTGKQSIKMQTA
ncbi:MAG: DUF2442 domain-containing protein [Fibrobacterota bacterium]